MMTDFAEKKCLPCEGGAKPLSTDQAREYCSKLEHWELDEQKNEISKKFTFKNFYKTMAFVNAIAWIANQENHHPDLRVGYGYCDISLKTHAISGLSENDFILAAKIDNLMK
jgi:4a-hydroxytetrahydrobiopterin dehydratase